MEKRKAAVKKEEDAAVVKRDVKKDVQPAKKEADGASNKVKKEVNTAASSEAKMQNMRSKSSKSSDAKAVTKKENGISKATAEVKTAKKEEVETKSVKVVKTRTVTTTTKVEKKKSYDLPGQKHDPPEERDPQRIFYESLREQIPSSEMAEVWLMEHGLLPEDEAKAACDRRQKQKKPSGPTPVKPSSSKVDNPPAKVAEANGRSRPVSKAGKSKRDDSSDDDDFILKPKKKLKS